MRSPSSSERGSTCRSCRRFFLPFQAFGSSFFFPCNPCCDLSCTLSYQIVRSSPLRSSIKSRSLIHRKSPHSELWRSFPLVKSRVFSVLKNLSFQLSPVNAFASSKSDRNHFFEKGALPPYTPVKGLALCKPTRVAPKRDMPRTYSIYLSIDPIDGWLNNCPIFGASHRLRRWTLYVRIQKKSRFQLSPVYTKTTVLSPFDKSLGCPILLST